MAMAIISQLTIRYLIGGLSLDGTRNGPRWLSLLFWILISCYHKYQILRFAAIVPRAFYEDVDSAA